MNYANITKLSSSDYASTEALNTICSNILFMGSENKKILLTSVAPHDGKSFVGMRLLQNLAQRGKRVVLVDADLRKSNLVKDYSIRFQDNKRGLSHYLAGMCTLNEAFYETNIPGAYLVPVGQIVANSIPLISNQRFNTMLNAFSEYFDIIIIDAPPIGCVVDAAIMASSCDGVIFVASYNQTTRRDMLEVKRQIQLTDCKILGCIINKVSFSSISSKKYYNKSYYNHYNNGYYTPSKKK